MYGWRARIGLIIAHSNTTMEPEFSRVAPEGVSVHAARVKVGARSIEGLTLGPRLPNGNFALLGIVDNGDGLLSANSLVAFELAGPLPRLAIRFAIPPASDWYLHLWAGAP